MDALLAARWRFLALPGVVSAACCRVLGTLGSGKDRRQAGMGPSENNYAREMAQQLKSAGDTGVVQSLTQRLTATCNPSSRESLALFWSTLHCMLMVHLGKTLTHKINLMFA